MALNLHLHPKHPQTHTPNLIVLLHGLRSSGETWTSPDRNWRELLLTDPSLPHADIAIADYRTALWNSKITRTTRQVTQGFWEQTGNRLIKWLRPDSHQPQDIRLGSGDPTPIDQLANDLKHELETDPFTRYQSIILIGHSMGGLVGIHYLLEEAKRNANPRIAGFISLATPYNGSSLADLKKLVDKLYTQEQIDALMPNSDFLDGLLRDWIELKEQARLHHVHFKFFYGEDDAIVNKTSAIPKTVADTWSGAIGLPGGHTEVLQVGTHGAKAYRFVKSHIQKVFSTRSAPPPKPTEPSVGRGGGTVALTEAHPDLDHLRNGDLSLRGERQGANAQSHEHANRAVSRTTSNQQVSTSAPTSTNQEAAITSTAPAGNRLAQATDPALHTDHAQRHMNAFIKRFPAAVQPDVRQAADEVADKLSQMPTAERQAFLRRYRYPFDTAHPEPSGTLELWTLLTLFHLLDPTWQLHNADEVANLHLPQTQAPHRWKRLLHSVYGETMPEILLALVERRKNSPYGEEIRAGGMAVCPHGVIVDNILPFPEKSLCRHCRPEQTFPFGNILRTFTADEDRELFRGVEPESNTYKDLEQIDVTCTTCIQAHALQATDKDALQQTIRDVI
ncbi:MAG TPA: ABC-three component system protein [Bacilli bacterium]|nr:ABC-three component system protein [Bacilli bacterium]